MPGQPQVRGDGDDKLSQEFAFSPVDGDADDNRGFFCDNALTDATRGWEERRGGVEERPSGENLLSMKTQIFSG